MLRIFVLLAIGGVALFGPALADGQALAQTVSGKGDGPPLPGQHAWEVQNGCQDAQRVSISADGVVRGWTELAPGEVVRFRSYDTVVGIHSYTRGLPAGYWAPGGSYHWYRAEMDRDFRHPTNAAPISSVKRNFHDFDILQTARIIICQSRPRG